MLHSAVLRRFLRLCALTGAFIVPLAFFTHFRDQFELPKLALTALLAFPTALGRLLSPLRRRPTVLEASILAVLATAAVSSLPGVSLAWRTSLLGDYENFGGILTAFTLASWFYGLGGGLKAPDFRRMHFFAVSAGFLSALYAIAQHTGIDFVRWNPETYNSAREFAGLGNPNFLAAYLAMVLPLHLSFSLDPTPPTGTSKSVTRAVLLALAGLILLFIVTILALYLYSFFALLLFSKHTWPLIPIPDLASAFAWAAGFISLSITLTYAFFRRGPWAAMGGSILLLLGLAATGSRGGALAALAGLAVYVFFHRSGSPAESPSFFPRFRPSAAKLLASLALLGFLGFFGAPFFSRLGHSMAHPLGSFSQSRAAIWKPAMRMAAAHPLTGVGLDCFKIAFTRYSDFDFNALDGTFVSSRTAHNEWLQAASTCGLPGLAALLLTTFLFLLLAVRRVSNAPSVDRPLWAAVLASGTAYLVQNLFSFGVAALLLLWNVHLASVNLAPSPPSGDAGNGPDPSPRLFFPALALSSLLALPIGMRLSADLGFAKGMAYLEYVQKPDRPLAPEETEALAFKSLKHLEQAADRFPLEVKYRLYTGMALEQLSASDPTALAAALKVYDRTVEWVPANAYFHNNRARVLLGISRKEGKPPVEAESALRNSVRFAPENPFFLTQWGTLLKTLGRDQEADAPLSRAFSLNPDVSSESMAQMALDDHQAGLKKNAYSILGEALARNPSSAECRFFRGYMEKKDGRKRESDRDFDEAVRLDPRLAELRRSLSEQK